MTGALGLAAGVGTAGHGWCSLFSCSSLGTGRHSAPAWLCWSSRSLYPRKNDGCFLLNTAATHPVLSRPECPSSPSEAQGFPDRIY